MSKIKIVEDLSKRWENSGLSLGDSFLLHSNIRRLLLEFKKKKLDINADLIIDSFLNVLKMEQFIPFFNFDFPKPIISL